MPEASNSVSRQPVKLHYIDQLRGVAILLVIITHVALKDNLINPVLREVLLQGRIGVQLFFFLSAYTLCLSMSERHEEHQKKKFYIRRLFRIAPLYYVGILTYFVLNFISSRSNHLMVAHDPNYNLINIFCNVFFVHGFINRAYNAVVPGGWSIGTEMIFYAAFPYLFLLYQKSKKEGYILWPIVALAISFIYYFFCLFIYHDEAFTNHFFFAFILNQLPVFVVGISYFFLNKKKAIFLPNIISLPAALFLFTIAMFLMYYWSTNINVAIFIAALSFALLFTFFKKCGFHLPFLQKVGQLSYSIYIFHFLFAYTVSSRVSHLLSPTVNPYVIFFINLTQTILFTMLIAMISEKVIEKPGISIGKALIKKITYRK